MPKDALDKTSESDTQKKLARSHKFYAIFNRLKLIQRWSLMHNQCPEDVAQHSHQTAVFAHALGVIDKTVFKKDTDPGKCATIALFHEASEVLTGDMPTPVKYRNTAMYEAYKEAEKDATDRLLYCLPAEIEPKIRAVVRPAPCREAFLVKCADKIAAYIKCVEELKAGNTEFAAARRSAERLITGYRDETVDYFMARFADAFSLNLDELMDE
ncbi:MAG: 5'-deoxynucleotidase [Firmicutes bacterium]|nr:5'-deoxynucleotidase [Bacillota bacterium]